MLDFIEKHVINDCDEYRAVLSEFRTDTDEQFLLVHLSFKQFSKSALQKLLHDWKVFRQCVPAPLFAFCDPEDPEQAKWERFVSLLGFQPVEGIAMPSPHGDQRIFVSFQKGLSRVGREDNNQ